MLKPNLKCCHEANFPAEQPQATQNARIPCADAHDRRTQRTEATPQSRKGEARGIAKGPSKRRFETILQDGLRVTGDPGRLFATTGTGLVGIGISRQLGSKPARNRQRRRVRAALQAISMKQDLDYVLVIGVKSASMPFGELANLLQPMFVSMQRRWGDESRSL